MDTYPTGKVVLTKEHAELAARRGRRRRDNRLGEYRCDVCGQWHVGTPSRKDKDRRIPVLRNTHHHLLLETEMEETGLSARDVYARHTNKEGKSYVARHRVWNADRFFAARADEATKEGGKAKCEQITEQQFNKERAK